MLSKDERELRSNIGKTYRMLAATHRVLTGDRAARMDWELFLCVACAAYLRDPFERHDPLRHMTAHGEWVEAVSRQWVPSDTPLPERALARLGEAVMAWNEAHPAQLGWEALDRGLTAAIAERTIKVDALMLSPAAARLVVDFLEPGPGQWLLSYGSAGGEVAGAFTERALRHEQVPFPLVRSIDRRSSLHPLTKVRVLMVAGAAEAVSLVETGERLPPAYDSYIPLVYAAFLDEQDDHDQSRKVDYHFDQINRLTDALLPGGRMALAVPEVVLHGATWERMREGWLKSGYLRMIVQLPREAVRNGTIKCGLVFLEKRAPWPPVSGVTMADLRVRLGDLDPESVEQVRMALRLQAPTKPMVWFQERPAYERLDPAFYLGRKAVARTLGKLRWPMKTLHELGVDVRKNSDAVGHRGELDDRTVTTGAIEGLRIDKDHCSTGPMPSSHELYEGLVLLTTGGTIGKAAVVTPEFRGFRLGSSMVALALRGSHLDPHYLAVLLQSELGQAMLALLTKGSRTDFIPMHELRDLQIPVLPLDVQRQIADKAIALYEAAYDLKQQALRHEKQAQAVFAMK